MEIPVCFESTVSLGAEGAVWFRGRAILSTIDSRWAVEGTLPGYPPAFADTWLEAIGLHAERVADDVTRILRAQPMESGREAAMRRFLGHFILAGRDSRWHELADKIGDGANLPPELKALVSPDQSIALDFEIRKGSFADSPKPHVFIPTDTVARRQANWAFGGRGAS
jgi:hypothetical protein